MKIIPSSILPGLACVGAFLLLCVCLCESTHAQDSSIYVVDEEQVMRASRAGAAARTHIAEAAAALESGFEALQKAWAKHPEADRKRAIAEGAEILRRQLAAERHAAAEAVRALMLEAIRSWRAASNASLILGKQNVLDAANDVDITPAIIKAMDTKEPKFPPLPSVSVNAPTLRKSMKVPDVGKAKKERKKSAQ